MKVSRNNRIYIILRKTWRRIKRKTDELEYTLRLFKVRNTAILYQNNRKQIENQVNLHWFSLERSDHKENVGDYLSTVVCDYMLLQRGISLKKIVNRKKEFICNWFNYRWRGSECYSLGKWVDPWRKVYF